MSDRQMGTVKWFNDSKRFRLHQPRQWPGCVRAFPRHPGSGFPYLQEGQKVSFKVVQGQKGLQADEVRPGKRHGAPSPMPWHHDPGGDTRGFLPPP